MNRRNSITVRRLSAKVRAISTETMDLPAEIATLVKLAADLETDPYMMLGVLAESIAHTVARSIHIQKQVETAIGFIKLLHDRLSDEGMIR
jgi:hypothetical protein